jgi:genome maintenance exonuclease 1
MRNFIHHEFGRLERYTNPEGKRIYKTPSGKSYPSVTSVTGLFGKEAIMEWRKRVGEEEATRISTRAATRGTKVHTLCEHYLLGKPLNIDMFDIEMFNGIKPYLDKIENVHALESQLYSDHLQVAGTVDCIAEYEGNLSVIDFKTSSRVKTRDDIHNYFMQTAAYAVAFEERTGIPVGRMVVIMGVDNDSPIIFKEKRDTWIGDFIELRTQYRNKFAL